MKRQSWGGGLFLLWACSAVLWYTQRGDGFTFLFAGMSGVAVQALLAALTAARGFELSREERGGDGAYEAGQSIRYTVHVRKALGITPLPWILVQDIWTAVPGDGQEGQERIAEDIVCSRLLTPWFRRMVKADVELPAMPRGIYELQRTRLTYGDLFGFWTRHRNAAGMKGFRKAIVFPRLRPVVLPSGGIGDAAVTHHRMRAPAGMPSGLVRSYEPGDPLRWIHARSTAKLGVWKSMQLEPNDGGGLLIVVDDRDVRFEDSIEIAAGLLEKASRNGQKASLMVMGNSGMATMQDAWVRLAAARPAVEGNRHVNAVKREASKLERGSHVIMVAAQADEQLALLLGDLRLGGLETALYLTETAQSSASGRWMLRRMAAQGCRVVFEDGTMLGQGRSWSEWNGAAKRDNDAPDLAAGPVDAADTADAENAGGPGSNEGAAASSHLARKRRTSMEVDTGFGANAAAGGGTDVSV